jgi:hypothetical protein
LIVTILLNDYLLITLKVDFQINAKHFKIFLVQL